MTSHEKNALVKKAGALRPIHHRLTSGRHCGVDLQCARVYEDAGLTETLVSDVLSRFTEVHFDAVVGLALGGVIPAYEAARQLGARCLFTERVNGRMVFRRGFELKQGERVLIMEDVITTGGSVREVIALIEGAGAQVMGVGSLIDRSGGRADFDVPLSVALDVEIESYEPEDCPLCKAGKPLERTFGGNKRRI